VISSCACLLVEQAQVVEIRVEVLPHPPDVRERHRLMRETLVARGRRLLEHDLEVDQQMLVRQRDAHGVGLHGPEHGLGLTRQRVRHDDLLLRHRIIGER
jgi:hypothetical protein